MRSKLPRACQGAVAAWLLVCVTAAPSVAEVLVVTSTADDGPGSLREVIGIATAGDTIEFAVAR